MGQGACRNVGNTGTAFKLELFLNAFRSRSSLLFLHLVLADCLATAFCVGGQLAWEIQDQVRDGADWTRLD